MSVIQHSRTPQERLASVIGASGPGIDQIIPRLLFIALLIGCSLVFLAPFAWLVSASLKTRSEVFSSAWIPDPFAWNNYVLSLIHI